MFRFSQKITERVPQPPPCYYMMTSSNGNIFRVTGHLCGEFTGPRWIPAQRSVTRSFDVFFDLHPNKRLSKQWWGLWGKPPVITGSPSQRPVTRSVLWSAPEQMVVQTHAGDVRRYRAHYDVTVMWLKYLTDIYFSQSSNFPDYEYDWGATRDVLWLSYEPAMTKDFYD